MKYTLAISAVIFTLGFVTLPIVWSSENPSWNKFTANKSSSYAVTVAADPVYQEECGGCHMAYPPGLLPGRSWEKLMLGLENHFGDNAELDAETQQLITEVLLSRSADRSKNKPSKKFTRSIKLNDAPLRISATPYFIREHDEIPIRMVTGNPKVNSLSQCNACHTKAEQGLFNEHDVYIPGYGHWDD
ncbi:MAG: diheme cytochrome c [Xanthomonadales bacterium]|nr:diheme cytochrome c [Xanthomonadales bacterium]